MAIPSRAKIALLSLLLPALALAQSFNIPVCSTGCITSAPSSSTCAILDFLCLCSDKEWLQSFAQCVRQNCAQDDIKSVADNLSGACSAAGTTIAIPPDQLAADGNAAVDPTASVQITTSLFLPTELAVSSLVAPSSLNFDTFTAYTSVPIPSSAPPPTTAAAVPYTQADSPSIDYTTSFVTVAGPAPTVVVATVGPAPPPPAPPVACGDDSLLLTPENWVKNNVDQNLAFWWANNVTAAQKSSSSFVQLLGSLYGDVNLQCGIGTDATCQKPSCDAFRGRGLPPWSYFVVNAIVQFNQLMNNMVAGITNAEAGLALLLPDMSKLFPEPAQQSPLQEALPWIGVAVGGLLAFIPIIGLLLELGAIESGVLTGVAGTASQLVQGGLDTLDATPVSDDFGDLRALGTYVYTAFHNTSSVLDQWSSALLTGKPDVSGKTLIDYVANGRFAIGSNGSTPNPINIGTFYSQILSSKFANEVWKNHTSTFVMCANATDVPCRNSSLHATADGRSCCLYGLDGDSNYQDPPGYARLTDAHVYAIPPANITASALASYLSAKFDYNQDNFQRDLNAQITRDPSKQAFLQGASFAGVYTLPVCDVGSRGSWVAEYSARQLPCCCGPNCAETDAFIKAANLDDNGAFKTACKAQFADFKSAAGRLVPSWPLMAVLIGASLTSILWFL